MTPKDRLIQAGRRQAHERADREGKPMLVWLHEGGACGLTVYVRSEAGDPEFQSTSLPAEAQLVDRIMPGTEL